MLRPSRCLGSLLPPDQRGRRAEDAESLSAAEILKEDQEEELEPGANEAAPGLGRSASSSWLGRPLLRSAAPLSAPLAVAESHAQSAVLCRAADNWVGDAGLKPRRQRPDLTAVERVWIWSDDPRSSHSAWLWAALVLVLIIISSVAFLMESVPAFCCGKYDSVWKVIESICVAVFTVEYLLRFVSCPWYFPAESPPQASAAKDGQGEATAVPTQSIRAHLLAR